MRARDTCSCRDGMVIAVDLDKGPLRVQKGLVGYGSRRVLGGGLIIGMRVGGVESAG